MHPRWIRAAIAVRGVMPFLLERQVLDKMPEFDRISAEEAERLGEEASGLVGAGGEAALRSPAAHR